MCDQAKDRNFSIPHIRFSGITTAVTDDHPVLIEARSVAMSFGATQPALTDVSCSIRAGEFVAILGPSGCGKSTLLRLVAGLMPPTGGNLTVAGVSPEEARRRARKVAFVFQEPN